MNLSCILMGENFSPSAVEKSINVFFHEKNEKGEIAKIGRFNGRSFPYGSCIMRDQHYKELVIEFLENNMGKLKEYGVDNISLRLDVSYDSQCNFELDSNFLSRIAKLSIPLSVSCYKND